MWSAVLDCWSRVYVRHPNCIISDIEASVNLDLFCKLTEMNEINLHLSSMRAHSTIGIWERYHAPFRRIYSAVS